MSRIYHPHHMLEEHKHGMWKTILGSERERLLQEAIAFTGNAPLYGQYMRRVAVEWKWSCEHNLTCEDMNRQAWIGHAATCLALGCPEDITRAAWHCLTQQQQDEANAQADSAIKLFLDSHVEGGLFCA
jgi:hypothetical protein